MGIDTEVLLNFNSVNLPQQNGREYSEVTIYTLTKAGQNANKSGVKIKDMQEGLHYHKRIVTYADIMERDRKLDVQIQKYYKEEKFHRSRKSSSYLDSVSSLPSV